VCTWQIGDDEHGRGRAMQMLVEEKP
jgi:hypothetical protein